jgi:enamine deaminase RidA (YjgF/YER057c/UK114 family)
MVTTVEQMRGRVELINPETLGPARGFSHVAASGDKVWVAGQIGCDASGRVLSPDSITDQFARAIENVGTALAAAGCRPQDVVKITYFVTDVPAYRAALGPIGEAYRRVFGRHYPATTLVGAAALFDPDALVEIECTAVRPS